MITIKLLEGADCISREQSCADRASLTVSGIYPPDAILTFASDSRYLWVQVDQAVLPALVYLPDASFSYRIPCDEQRPAFPPQAFSGELHLVRAWLPDAEELHKRRNLALNPADQRGAVTAFPHAEANVETRGEAVFAARNVIDGCLENSSHGAWPYQSWGIGAREDAWCKLDFGRTVEVDRMALVLRADFPHDAYWVRGYVALSDGASIPFTLERTGEKQYIDLGVRRVSWMRLERLEKSDDPSAFPALTEWEVYGINL